MVGLAIQNHSHVTKEQLLENVVNQIVIWNSDQRKIFGLI
jgi:hypothetical protein